jgi:hypothetical protein
VQQVGKDTGGQANAQQQTKSTGNMQMQISHRASVDRLYTIPIASDMAKRTRAK